jgi:hypothetical protein
MQSLFPVFFPALTTLKRKCSLSIAERINLPPFHLSLVSQYLTGISVLGDLVVLFFLYLRTVLWLVVDLSRGKRLIDYLIDSKGNLSTGLHRAG